MIMSRHYQDPQLSHSHCLVTVCKEGRDCTERRKQHLPSMQPHLRAKAAVTQWLALLWINDCRAYCCHTSGTKLRAVQLLAECSPNLFTELQTLNQLDCCEWCIGGEGLETFPISESTFWWVYFSPFLPPTPLCMSLHNAVGSCCGWRAFESCCSSHLAGQRGWWWWFDSWTIWS